MNLTMKKNDIKRNCAHLNKNLFVRRMCEVMDERWSDDQVKVAGMQRMGMVQNRSV